MSVEVTYKSNTAQFLSQYRGDKAAALEAIGKIGVEAIKKEAPVDTGNLRDATFFRTSEGDSIEFVNNAQKDGEMYPAYVELGTYKTVANPFMRRGVVTSQAEFISILASNLKV